MIRNFQSSAEDSQREADESKAVADELKLTAKEQRSEHRKEIQDLQLQGNDYKSKWESEQTDSASTQTANYNKNCT